MAKLTDGLVEFWKLNEASGTRAGSLAAFNLTDSGATGQGVFNPLNDPTIEGANCASFNETTVLNVLDNASLRISLTRGLTLSCWAQVAALTSDQYLIAGKGTATDGFEYVIHYQNFGFNPGAFVASVGVGAEYSIGSPFLFETGTTPLVGTPQKWAHLVLTFSPGPTYPTMSFYINNILRGTVVVGNPALIQGTISRFAVGARETNAGVIAKNFNGKIANVGLWSRALYPWEIGDLYNGGVGRTYPFPGLTG